LTVLTFHKNNELHQHNTDRQTENKRLVRTAQWRKMIITDETKSYNLFLVLFPQTPGATVEVPVAVQLSEGDARGAGKVGKFQ